MITEAQRLERKNSIGASDSAAILGLNPWKSALELFHEKRGDIEDADLSGNEAVQLGNDLEPIIMQRAARMLKAEIVTDADLLQFTLKDYPFITCNLDGFYHDRKNMILVEAKYSAHGDNWGEVGSDQVPPQYWIQVQHQMMVTGAKTCFIVRLNPNFGITFDLYKIDYNKAACDELFISIMEFWKLVKETPAGEVPEALSNDRLSLDALKRFKRETDKGVELSADIDLEIDFYNIQNEAEKTAKVKKERHKGAILQALGKGDHGTTASGTLVTYYANKNGARTLRIKEPAE